MYLISTFTTTKRQGWVSYYGLMMTSKLNLDARPFLKNFFAERLIDPKTAHKVITKFSPVCDHYRAYASTQLEPPKPCNMCTIRQWVFYLPHLPTLNTSQLSFEVLFCLSYIFWFVHSVSNIVCGPPSYCIRTQWYDFMRSLSWFIYTTSR